MYRNEPSLFERYVNFEFYKTKYIVNYTLKVFERYVNFEFYKTYEVPKTTAQRLRDM